MTNTNIIWLGWSIKKDGDEPPLLSLSIHFYQRVSSQEVSSLTYPVLVPFWPIPFYSLTSYSYTPTIYISVHICTYKPVNSFQVPFPWYLKSTPCPYLILQLSRSWGSLLSLLSYSWYNWTNIFFMVSKYAFFPGYNMHLFYPNLY